jgi:hypothetical protein
MALSVLPFMRLRLGWAGAVVLCSGCSAADPAANTTPHDAGSPLPSGPYDAAALSYVTAAAVPGTADSHCVAASGAKIVQSTSSASCTPDAAAFPGGGTGLSYGATMFGSSGDDDNCKYSVSWASTPIVVGEPVWFEVTANHLTDGSPLTGAAPLAETFRALTLDPGPASNANQNPSEIAPGVYVVGPLLFDESNASGEAGASGILPYWTVRFHFYETCSDLLPDSPHGHAAFYLRVPSSP